MYSLGDPKKAAQVLDWRTTVRLPEIVARMIRAEREAFRQPETATAGVAVLGARKKANLL
jgi:hypothetical protein